jgi:hypothetical protein
VKCAKCGKLLLEFERGARSDEVKVNRYCATVVRPGIANCDTVAAKRLSTPSTAAALSVKGATSR